MFPSKTRVKKLRNEIFLADMNDVMTERDYAKELKSEFDMEI